MNLFIGSSSIAVFKFFKNPNYKVLKVTAATAKGLYINENGKNIIKFILNVKTEINCIVLYFGTVDINFSYYYKVCNSEDKNINYKEYCNEVYIEYIKFINKIVEISKCKYLIIKGLYPNPIKDNLKSTQLINYGTVKNSNCLLKSTLNSIFQEKFRKYYNNLLHKFCIEKNKIHNTNTKYFYYDLDKYIFINGKIDKKFIDLSPITIHLRWEPMIPYHIKILNKFCGLSEKDLVDIKKVEEKYLKYKKNILKKRGLLNKINKTNKTKKYKKNSLSNINSFINKSFTNKNEYNNINSFINKINK